MKKTDRFKVKICPRARRGENLRIKTAAFSCAGRTLTIGAHQGQICYAGFTDDPAEILAHYPLAAIELNGLTDKALIERLQKALTDGNIRDLDFYLEGSDFQCAVWDALAQIPPGETTSYAALAHGLGRPKAFRAVGNAVGANPVSVLIPCHRVIHSAGKKMGYAWGVEVKKDLLTAEGVL